MGGSVFVRRKIVKGKHYFQVVENNRVGGRVCQAVLVSLRQWPTLPAAKAAIPERLHELECLVAAKRQEQSQADSHRPWPKYTRSGQTNWRLVHQRASQDIRRRRHEITSLLEDIQELEQEVTR
jgi:hypothetical protein